jgi:hypothetical protein
MLLFLARQSLLKRDRRNHIIARFEVAVEALIAPRSGASLDQRKGELPTPKGVGF